MLTVPTALTIAYVLSTIGYAYLTYTTIDATMTKNSMRLPLWILMIVGFVSIALRTPYIVG